MPCTWYIDLAIIDIFTERLHIKKSETRFHHQKNMMVIFKFDAVLDNHVIYMKTRKLIQ